MAVRSLTARSFSLSTILLTLFFETNLLQQPMENFRNKIVDFGQKTILQPNRTKTNGIPNSKFPATCNFRPPGKNLMMPLNYPERINYNAGEKRNGIPKRNFRPPRARTGNELQKHISVGRGGRKKLCSSDPSPSGPKMGRFLSDRSPRDSIFSTPLATPFGPDDPKKGDQKQYPVSVRIYDIVLLLVNYLC